MGAALRPPEIRSLVYIRYKDHVLFRNADPGEQKPIIQEAVGWLDYEDEDHIRLVLARYQEPAGDGYQRTKATGLVILKSTIVEMRRIA